MPRLIPRGSVVDVWRGARSRRFAVAPDALDRAPVPLRAALLSAADAERGAAWPDLLLDDWAAYATRGSRLAYEDPLFSRWERTARAVLATALDPAPDRIAEAANGLWLLCEQSSWCWPAHDDSFARGRATTDTARPFLDLGAGEAGALAAWAELTIGPQLDEAYPGIRERLAREATARVLDPLLAERWHWEGTEERMHNWAPWISGNALVAAHAFATGDLFDRASERAIDIIDRYLAQLPADGAIDEGVGYWWQGAARALEALAVLDAVTDGAIAAEARPGGRLAGLEQLVRFPERTHLGGEWFASWSDAEPRMSEPMPWQVLHAAATLVGAPSAAGFAAARADDDRLLRGAASSQAGLGRLLGTLMAGDWRSGGADPLPRRVDLASIGVGLARETEGSTAGLTVIAKAGHNDEAHNHNDLGSIEIAVDGVPVIVDLGRETYDATTFSAARNDLWYVSSPWHSVPLPRGLSQREGAVGRATMTPTEAGWTLELGDAYPLEDGESWTRCVELDAGAVRLRDEWALARGTGSIVLVCAGAPRETADGIHVPSVSGGRGILLTHDAARVQLQTREVADPLMARSWGDAIARIVLTADEAATSLELTVVAS